MTEKQYWDSNVYLAKHYREAYNLKQEIRQQEYNRSAWLNGIYMIQAIAPMLSKEAKPYPAKPLPITEKEAKREEKRKQEEIWAKQKATLEAFIAGYQEE